MVKNPPAMQETWVRSLSWEDPLEKEMATNSSILAGESHGQRSLAGYSHGVVKESDRTEQLTLPLFFPTGSQKIPPSDGHYCGLLLLGSRAPLFLKEPG